MTPEELDQYGFACREVRHPDYVPTWEKPDPYPPPPGAKAAGRPRAMAVLLECKACRLPFRPRRRASRCCSPRCAARLSLRKRPVLIDPDALWRLADEPNLAEAARRLGVEPDSLRKAMRRAGVPPRPVGRPRRGK
jgi:hypothetical protein